MQGGEAFFRGVLESMQSVYLNRNRTAKAILDLVHSAENNSLCYDHLAFRTFGVLLMALLPYTSTFFCVTQLFLISPFVCIVALN